MTYTIIPQSPSSEALDHGYSDLASRHCTHQTRVRIALRRIGSSPEFAVEPPSNRFLLSLQARDVPDDDAAEGSTSHTNGRPEAGPQVAEEPGKRLSGAQRKKLAKEERKQKRGANKGRRFQKVRDELELCFRVASGKQCEFGEEYVVSGVRR